MKLLVLLLTSLSASAAMAAPTILDATTLTNFKVVPYNVHYDNRNNETNVPVSSIDNGQNVEAILTLKTGKTVTIDGYTADNSTVEDLNLQLTRVLSGYVVVAEDSNAAVCFTELAIVDTANDLMTFDKQAKKCP